jgi:hypothetical protein
VLGILVCATDAQTTPVRKHWSLDLGDCAFERYRKVPLQEPVIILACRDGVSIAVPVSSWGKIWDGAVPPFPGTGPEVGR